MKKIDELSAAQLVRVYNAVTDQKPVKKFESTPRGLERTLAELARRGVSTGQALVMAGINPEPGDTQTVLNLANGEMIGKPTLHPAVRETPKNPEASAREVAKKAAAAERTTALIDRSWANPNDARAWLEANPQPGFDVKFDAENAVYRIARSEPVAPASGATAPADKPAGKGRRKPAAAVAPARAPASEADLAPPRADWQRTNRTVPLMVDAMREKGRTLEELQTIGRWGAPVELRHLRRMEQLANVKIVAVGDEKPARFKVAA